MQKPRKKLPVAVVSVWVASQTVPAKADTQLCADVTGCVRGAFLRRAPCSALNAGPVQWVPAEPRLTDDAPGGHRGECVRVSPPPAHGGFAM